MKERISKSLAKAVKNMGRRAAARDANTSCVMLGYQPKLPEEVSNMKKGKK